MYTESATRYFTVTLNSVTGRSASITVCELAGVTSVNHGDAASCRRNVVYAWISTVRPSIETLTAGAPLESRSIVTGPLFGCPAPGATMADAVRTCVIQVYGGSAFVAWSRTCGQIYRSASIWRITL